MNLINLIFRILIDENGGTLAITRKTANTLITSAGFNTNYTEIEAVVNALDGDNIEDDAIDSEHYVDASIDLAHLSADCVDGTKIADEAIDSEHYVDGSIDNEHIADGVIDLTSKVTGALPEANGGSGATSFAHGASQHTDITRHFFIPAQSCQFSGTNCVRALATNDYQDSIFFDNGQTNRAHATFRVPSDYASGLKVYAWWRSAAASGNLAYHTGEGGISPNVAGADGEAYNNHTTSSVTTNTVATNGADAYNKLDLSGDSVFATFVGLLAAGDIASISFDRLGGDGSDTLNDDVYFLGFEVEYTANQ